ncbi:hypothetical protein [Mesorhizobium sp. M0491]|uniref:hypothetical protein n=1 Tax=Mesorhizobium sp. M0491 TaxID=2956950 RepID=UPI0033377748
MRQHPTSHDTVQAIEAAMAKYEAQVLDPLRFDERTGLYVYGERVTIKAILELAGVRSRSTLHADHHEGLRGRIDDLIRDLKLKTGKAPRRISSENETAEHGVPRVDALAQTIAALNFRLMRLEKESFPAAVGQANLPGAARDRRQRQSPSRR